MRAFAMTGMLTASWMPTIISGSDIRATPPSRRMSAGTRSSAMTAAAPASSAILAWSGVTTSMITPPLSISASPALTVKVASSRGMCPLSSIRGECSRAVAFPAMSAPPVFDGSDGRFVATELARGPWDPGAQHGGAPAALLMRAFEGLPGPDGLVLARVTYEFLRPAPIAPISVQADVIRPGRRVQLLEGSMLADGVEVVRARALRILSADPGPGGDPDVPPPPGPEAGRARALQAPHRPM